MNALALCRTLAATACLLLIVGPVEAQDSAKKKSKEQAEEKETPRKGFGSGVSEDSKKDEAKEEKKSSGGFGADRKKKEESTRPSKEEKERMRGVRTIEKRLGRRDEGYFMLELFERKFEAPPEPAEDAPPNVRRRQPTGWVPVDESKVIVLEGREATANFLYDYMTEFADDEDKSRRGRRKRDPEAAPEKPNPVRNYKFLFRYDTNEQAAYGEAQYKALKEQQAQQRAAQRKLRGQ